MSRYFKKMMVVFCVLCSSAATFGMDLYKERVYLEARAIANEYNGEVGWEGSTKTVTLKCNGNTAIMRIGDKKVVINGEEVQLYVAPMQMDGKAMVPIYVYDQLKGEEDKNIETVTADELKAVPIEKYGNAFKGRLNRNYYDKVIIAKHSDLPIQVGQLKIHDITAKGDTITVKQEWIGGDWRADRLLIADKDGLCRARDAYEQSKDSNGIITAKYAEKNCVDQLFDTKYKSYSLDKIHYFIMTDDTGTLIALPKSEVVR